jgi:hypothetical protein
MDLFILFFFCTPTANEIYIVSHPQVLAIYRSLFAQLANQTHKHSLTHTHSHNTHTHSKMHTHTQNAHSESEASLACAKDFPRLSGRPAGFQFVSRKVCQEHISTITIIIWVRGYHKFILNQVIVLNVPFILQNLFKILTKIWFEIVSLDSIPQRE